MKHVSFQGKKVVLSPPFIRGNILFFVLSVTLRFHSITTERFDPETLYLVCELFMFSR